MDGTGAVFLQGGEVIGAAISLVMGKAVSGVLRVVIDHQAIARYFGDDRRGGYRKRLAITAYDRLFGEWAAGMALPSMSTRSGEMLRAASASHMAWWVALRMLYLSISCGDALPTPMARAVLWMVSKKFCSAFFG